MGGATVAHSTVCFAEQFLGVFVVDDWNPIASAVPGQSSATFVSGIAGGLGRGDEASRVVVSSDAHDNAYMRSASVSPSERAQLQSLVDVRAVRCAELLSQLRALLANPSAGTEAAFHNALETLVDTPTEETSAQLVECLLTVAHYFYLSNQANAALLPTTLAEKFARQLGERRLLRKALTFAGVMQMEAGNLPGTTETYLEALTVARELGEEEQEAPVWNNLGVALLSSGQYADALKCFERAATLATNSLIYANVEQQAQSNVAICALRLHDVRTGIRAVRRAIELNAHPATASDCLDRTNAESNYAHLLLEIGEVGRAQEHCGIARMYAEKAPTARAEYHAAITSGLVDVHAKRTDVGLTRLRSSLEQARSTVRSEVREALSACVAGYEAAGQADIALVYLHELLALNRERIGEQLLARVRSLAPGVATQREVRPHFADPVNAKAFELEAMVRRSINDLVTAAITGVERAGHDRRRLFRVARLAELFALSEGWTADRAEALAFAARLCDLGMMVIPDALLRKPRGLSAGERKVMYEHTQFGAELLTKAGLAVLQPCVPVAKFHHERWDGAGPWNLVGSAIPIEARFVTLADAFDALTHARPWREALSLPATLRTITAEAGTRFDPELAVRFVAWIKSVYWDYDDFDALLAEHAHENEYVRARAHIDRLVKGAA